MSESTRLLGPVDDPDASNYGGTTSSSRRGRYQDIFHSDPVAISWHNLNVTNKASKRQILYNISGFVKPGQFVALMGTSGAGKTTLLNTLLSRNVKEFLIDGTVLVNGQELGSTITYISGYIQQNELFLSTLTVKEWLLAQAHLRLVGHDKGMLERRVQRVIRDLGLQDCQNSRIGLRGIKKGISGGEARRLSLAAELLNNPSILFADEPTTGLDSSMAESVVNIMSKLAKSGKTIICTIHQPSSTIYNKFDRVIFLANGRLAYFGTPVNAAYFLDRMGYPTPKNYNPADAFIQALGIDPHAEYESRDRIQKICEGFRTSKEGDDMISDSEICRIEISPPPQERKKAGVFVQISTLFKRSLLDTFRNPGLARAKIIQKFIMGLFIGLLYLNTPLSKFGVSNLNGAMFYIVAELSYSTLFGVLIFLPADYPLLVREYHDGLYKVFSFYVARSASYIPLFLLDGMIMVSVAYWMTGLVRNVQRFFISLLICVLVEQCAVAFGIMLSAVSPSYPVAISIAGPVMTILTLGGGMYANIGEMPSYVSWVPFISWFRYGFESLSINQWEGASTLCAESRTDYCPSSESILAKFSFSTSRFYTDIFLMLCLIFVFFSVGFFGLLFRVRKSR